MPSMVGPVNIGSNSGEVNFGDVLNMSSKSSTKTFKGQGGDSVGNINNELNGASPVNTWNVVGVDQPVEGNV